MAILNRLLLLMSLIIMVITAQAQTNGTCENDWVTGPFSDCSVSCGGGTITRTVSCEDCNGNIVPDSECAYIGAKPVSTLICNTQPCCEYNWVTGPFGSCSVSCGGGTQTRTVSCQDCNGNIIPDSQCANAGTKPNYFQDCNTQPCCEYDWVTGPFGSCSVSCGGGIQTRTIICQDCNGSTVSDALCSAVKPASIQSCNTQPCCENDWIVGLWSNCSVTCGGGTKIRTVICQDCNGAVVSDGNCPSPKPASIQDCNIQPCCDNIWIIGSWSNCSVSCGGGTQTRSVICQDCNGSVVSDALCSGVKPASTQSCNTQPCCEYDWVTGPFGSCSVSCGGGTQTRTVICQDCNGSIVSDALCSGVKPASIQSCNTQPCCEYDWVTGPFGSCSVSCGGGTQTRNVICQDCNGSVVSDALCSSVKPAYSQECNTQPCPINCVVSEWSEWSACSDSCTSGGIQTRTRTVLVAAQYGGFPCPALTETRACRPYPCNASCVTPDTTSWSACDGTCPVGTQFRTIYYVNALNTICDSIFETRTCPISSTLQLTIDNTSYLLYGPGLTGCITLEPDTVFGGQAPYNYAWSSGDSTASISVCTTDTLTYSLTVTDNNGCTAEDSILVLPINVSCGGQNNNVNICWIVGKANPKTLCVSEEAAIKLLAKHPESYYGRCGKNWSAKMGTEDSGGFEPMKLNAYPNPFNNQLYIDFNIPYESNVRIELFDISGKLIKVVYNSTPKAGETNKILIETKDLADGMLLYRMQTSSETLTGRIVKINR